MLILLLEGAPSVPRETQTPELIISFMGAKPSIRIAAAGQWETLTPAFERKSIWDGRKMMVIFYKLNGSNTNYFPYILIKIEVWT